MLRGVSPITYVARVRLARMLAAELVVALPLILQKAGGLQPTPLLGSLGWRLCCHVRYATDRVGNDLTGELASC